MDVFPSGQGRIEVITGPMFAGKSEELHRRLRRALYANQKVFLATRDTRYGEGVSTTHNGKNMKAHYCATWEDLEALLGDPKVDRHVVGLDEGQFWGDQLASVCLSLASRNVRVIVSGLDMDFQETPFQNMALLMGVAEYVDKLTAICLSCGDPATRSFRKVEATERVLEGASEYYVPFCRVCYSTSVEMGQQAL